MSLYRLLKQGRSRMDEDLSSSELRKYCSPIIYSQYKVTVPIIKKYINGKVLDLGCGYSPYRHLLVSNSVTIEGYDKQKYNRYVDYVGDAYQLESIVQKTYDHVICLEVLEHLKDTDAIIEQIDKVLNPGGYAIISVPLLNLLHEEPYDFYRFTSYGLEYIFKKNGFSVVEIKKKAGLFSFIAHQVAISLNSTFWFIPILREVVLLLTFVLISYPAFALDKLFGRNDKFAQGYIAVFRKTVDNAEN